jgi:hypothetical protein
VQGSANRPSNIIDVKVMTKSAPLSGEHFYASLSQSLVKEVVSQKFWGMFKNAPMKPVRIVIVVFNNCEHLLLVRCRRSDRGVGVEVALA